MTTIQIITVPYDSGHRGERMGAGPEYFLAQRVDEILRRQGTIVNVESVEAEHPFRAEIATGFELCRSLAKRVQIAVAQGSLPLVLSGNCNSALGTVSGVDPHDLGVIWFDAHGDFNTPETTTGGFLDGMGLATITGHCWTKLVATIPGFVPIPENHVLQVGVRQLDPEEQERLKQSQMLVVGGEQACQVGIRESITGALHTLRSHVKRVYVHIDLDVFDSLQVGRANSYAEPNGLSVDEMEEALSMIAHQFLIAAVGFASYDPGYDQEGKIFQSGVCLMECLIQAIQQEGQTTFGRSQ